MGPHDVARDRQSQTNTAGLPVAALLPAVKRLEHALDLRRRNARSVVLDLHHLHRCIPGDSRTVADPP